MTMRDIQADRAAVVALREQQPASIVEYIEELLALPEEELSGGAGDLAH